MTNRIPQEQIDSDKIIYRKGVIRDMPTENVLQYILALEEAYKEIEKLEMEKLSIVNQPKPSVDLKRL